TSISPILAKRQKELVAIIENWNDQSKIFAENFFDDYPIDALKKEAATLFDKVGPIIKSNPMIAENQLRGYCILDCARGKLKLSFTLSPENPALIQQYHLTLE
ncbi:MAG: hypothetical protein RIR55_1246, partial [Bacteroidota bacterium]